MTQSFDEWYFDAKQHNTDGFTNREFYEAGKQSRQAEIDELHLKCSRDSQALHNVIEVEVNKRDELQKRIDEVIKKLESIKADSLRPSHHDYDKGWRDCAITVLNDSKGKQDEK